MPLLLGADIGTTHTKVVVIDAEGRDAGASSVPTPFVTGDGRVEMTVEALQRCLGEVIAALGDLRSQVAAVGLAGMAESGAPLDSGRRPLAPVIAWHDGRGQEAVERLEQAFGPDLALRIGQPVRTVLTAAKLGWLVDHGMRGLDRWLGVPELGLYALTGAEAIECSQAARTGCYDVPGRRWMPEVGDALGFSAEAFAPVQPAGAVMGRVSAMGAEWSGLPAGIPVTVAGHDHLAGMGGASVGPGRLANSVGTAETIVARAPTCPNTTQARELGVAVTVYPGGDEWAALVSVVRSGIVLETASSALGQSPEQLDRLVANASPVRVDNVLDDLARGDASSLPSRDHGAVWAGLLDALGARTADACARLTALVGDPAGMVVFGGGSVSEPWLRAKARRVPFPVQRSPVASAVARGAAVWAGVAAGMWLSPDDAPAATTPERRAAEDPPPPRRSS